MVGPRTIATRTPRLLNIFPSTTSLLSGAPRRQLALPDLARQRQRLADRGALIGLDLSISAEISSSVAFLGGHQFLGKATPKITLRCFHQPGHQIFRHPVDRSILIDFGVDRISEAICRDALDENANLPTV